MDETVSSAVPPFGSLNWRADFAFLGKIVGVLHEELEQLECDFPGLEMLALLPVLDAQIVAMGDVEPPEADPILRKLLERRHAAMRQAA